MLNRRQFALLGLGMTSASVLGTWFANSAAAGSKEAFKIKKSPAEWKKLLTPMQYHVLREHGTERAFSSPLDKTYAEGTYHCAGCGQALYTSDTKYNSRTGWPSFYKPIDNAVGSSTDYKLIYPRTEIHCSRCGGHLGHVFKDGPQPTGLRYCMNGVALKFVPKDKE